jgi:hypothetical protein
MCQHAYLAMTAYARQASRVAIHNDDDLWLPEYLALEQASISRSNASGLFVPNALIIESRGQETGLMISPEPPPERSSSTAEQLAFWCRTVWGAFRGFVIRSAIATRLPPYEGQMVDVWMALWCLALGYSISCRTEPRLMYRRNAGQMTETGQTNLVDRHRMRVRLILRHGAAFLPKYPGLIVKALKSALFLLFRKKAVKIDPSR